MLTNANQKQNLNGSHQRRHCGIALVLWAILYTTTTTIPCVRADVASSVFVIKSLVDQETTLITHLQKIIEIGESMKENGTVIQRLKTFYDCIQYKHDLIARNSNFLVHPVVGFQLVHRLVADWGHVTDVESWGMSNAGNVKTLIDNLTSMRDIISKWSRWPKQSDTKDIAMGLLRIGQMYDIYPTTVWEGYPPYFPFYDLQNLQPNDVQFADNKLDSLDNTDKENLNTDDCVSDETKSNKNHNIHQCNNMPGSNRQTSNEKHSFPRNEKEALDKRNQNPAHVLQSNTNHSCFYDYNSLHIKDLLYLTKLAVDNKWRDATDSWYGRVLDVFKENDSKSKSNDGMEASIKKLKQRIDSSNYEEIINDDVVNNYIRLCKNSLHVESIKPSSNPNTTDSSLHCKWRYVYPYLRYKVEVLSSSPAVYQFYDVISPREIDHIIGMAKERLARSTLSGNVDITGKARYWRVSQTAWLTDSTSTIQTLSSRVALLTGLAKDEQTTNDPGTEWEPMQVVNYGLGGLYGPHLDTLDLNKTSRIDKNSGNRIATWMFYMGDVQAGGATVFPLLDVTVNPIKGSAVLWYNLQRNGQVDKMTVHAGCPVVIGDKWVGNKWIRETSQWKARPCLLDPSL